MADITMCVGTGCPLREWCYRYTATPNEHRQSFSDFTAKVVHMGQKGFECEEYIPNGELGMPNADVTGLAPREDNK